MSDMEHIDSESASDVMRWLQDEAAILWPAFLGSLSLRRSRCVRPNCAACLSGEQHQSYVLYDRAEGRRIAVYVPEELLPQVQRGLEKRARAAGSAASGGTAIHQALKRERTEAKKTEEG
jgi:hypothetical protein